MPASSGSNSRIAPPPARGGDSIGLQVPTPWGIQEGLAPAGEPRDMGGWTATTFSKEQQDEFGINELGVVKDQAKFEGALAALRLKARPPWWILAKVEPGGVATAEHAAVFTAEQQAQFGIDEFGKVLDKTKFDDAVAALQVQVMAPWWISAGIKPEGPDKDMGGWTACTFSKEQQEKYGVSELGRVIDQNKLNSALQENKTQD